MEESSGEKRGWDLVDGKRRRERPRRGMVEVKWVVGSRRKGLGPQGEWRTSGREGSKRVGGRSIGLAGERADIYRNRGHYVAAVALST